MGICDVGDSTPMTRALLSHVTNVTVARLLATTA